MPSKLMCEIEKLSPVQQLKIADEIFTRTEWPDIPFTPAQMKELDRRIEEHEKHPETSIPWEEVKKKLEILYPARRVRRPKPIKVSLPRQLIRDVMKLKDAKRFNLADEIFYRIDRTYPALTAADLRQIRRMIWDADMETWELWAQVRARRDPTMPAAERKLILKGPPSGL